MRCSLVRLTMLLVACGLSSITPTANASFVITNWTGAVAAEPFGGLAGTELEGEGLVDVTLSCDPIADTIPSEQCAKTFYEVAPATMEWNARNGFLSETFYNQTGMGLYSVNVALGDGFQILSDGWVTLPEGAYVTPYASSFMVHFPTRLPTGGMFAFDLTFAAVNGAAYTTITQTPSIPEPATLALFGIGLAGIGFARRRRRYAS